MIEVNEHTRDIYNRYFKGKKKKYWILFLSISTVLITVLPSINIVMVTFNYQGKLKNRLGIFTVEFHADNLPNGYTQHVVGNMYYNKEVASEAVNLTNPNPKRAPAVILFQGYVGDELIESYINVIGKETTGRWAIELAKRGFVVLAIDLPGQGYSTGTTPGLAPRADFEPYIVESAIDYLKQYDFIDNNSIGVAGVSYGGAAAALSAGVLGNKLNATVVVSGFTNFTDWLIRDNLKEEGVDFTYNSTHITIQSINGIPAKPSDLEERMRFYRLLQGDSKLIDPIIIPGTTSFNRTEIEKMDAVKYLPNARNDSILFIDPILDTTFGVDANQSGQGYNACTNGAVYFPIEAEHQLLGKDDADWAMINFFKEKLMGFNNFSHPNDNYQKYSEETDDLGLSYAQFYSNFDVIWYTIFYIFIGMIPVAIIINIMYLSKKFETERAHQEFSEEEQYVRFAGATFGKIINGLIFCFLIATLVLWVSGQGIENYILFISFLPIYYMSFYYTLCYLHDDEEIREIKGLKINESIETNRYESKRDKKNIIKIILLASIFILGSSILSGIFVPKDSPLGYPLDSIVLCFFIVGGVTSVFGIIWIYNKIRKNKDKLYWTDFKMDGFQLTRSFVFGTLIGTNFIVFYNPVAYYMKFPFLLGARTPYFITVLISVVLYAIGSYIWTEIIIRKSIYLGDSKIDKRKSWIISTIIGFGLIFGSSYMISFQIFQFGAWFTAPGIISLYVGIIFAGSYFIARLLDLVMLDKGIFATTLYIPGILISILGFFLRF